jgi:hypothetical protein
MPPTVSLANDPTHDIDDVVVVHIPIAFPRQVPNNPVGYIQNACFLQRRKEQSEARGSSQKGTKLLQWPPSFDE